MYNVIFWFAHFLFFAFKIESELWSSLALYTHELRKSTVEKGNWGEKRKFVNAQAESSSTCKRKEKRTRKRNLT